VPALTPSELLAVSAAARGSQRQTRLGRSPSRSSSRKQSASFGSTSNLVGRTHGGQRSRFSSMHGAARRTKVEASVDVDGFDLTRLTLAELSEMRNRVLSEHPELAEFGRAMTPSPWAIRASRVLLAGLRVLLDDAIDQGDRRTLLALLDQAFGRPRERVEKDLGRQRGSVPAFPGRAARDARACPCHSPRAQRRRPPGVERKPVVSGRRGRFGRRVHSSVHPRDST
jgi:hypothetical protein